MKGLLIKDCCLLRNQKKILPIYLILAVWFTVLYDDTFAFSYMMMMASILMTSTISYDEVDHSQGYLFVLPVERKTYVQEKFVLGFMLVLASLLLAAVCSIVRHLVRPDAAGTASGFLIALSACAGIAFIALMVPVRIRFGGDQGRIVIFAFFGLIALAAVLLSKVLPDSQERITGFFARMGTAAILLTAAGIAAILSFIGYALGVRWMRKKEF